MSVTDNFAKLKEQVEKADRTIKAAAEQNQRSRRRWTRRGGTPMNVRAS